MPVKRGARRAPIWVSGIRDKRRGADNLQCYHCLAVPKGDSNVPSRRTAKEPLREKVFSYYTRKERQLLEQAAERESRSLSSFVALAAIERARRILGRS
jgi:Protein of unknown function (DUF1778)